MNTDHDIDIDPGTEARVAAAMRSLAASHTPDPQPIDSVGAGRPGSPRWMLAAAAGTVLVVGLGALLVASNRDTGSTTDRLPVADATTSPIDTLDIVDDSETLPPVDPMTSSDTPLPDDVIPIIDPPPALPVNGFDLSQDTWRWMTGVEQRTTVAVLDDDRVIGSLEVLDSVAPWDTIADGQDILDIDGREAVRLDRSDERGLIFRRGRGVRSVLDTSPPADALSIDDTAAFAQLLGDGPIAEFVDTERFARVPLDADFGRNITYGSQSAVQLVQVRLEPDPADGAVDLVTQLYELFASTGGGGDQVNEVVQVSPVDLVLVIAGNDDQLASAISDLQLVSIDRSGVEFSGLGGVAGTEPIARGEPSWGRWQVTSGSGATPAETDDAVDADCRFFQVAVWSVDLTSQGFSDCGRNPTRSDGSRVFCAVLDTEIVGIVVGGSDDPTPPTFAVGPDIDGLTVEREVTDSEYGASTTFRVVQTEPGANIRAATVLVDGVEVDCGG